MAKLPFDKIEDSVIAALTEAGLLDLSTRKWVHDNSRFVCDFSAGDMVFSLDFNPQERDRVSLDFVPRTPAAITRALGNHYADKFNMRRNSSLTNCNIAMVSLLRKVEAAAKKAAAAGQPAG